MSVLKALMVAVSVAERKRDEARQVLQNAQAACQAAQGQLSQLEGYAEEIQERWGAKEGASLKPEVMYHHHQFMGRLGHAAGLQSGVVADHLQRLEAASRQLLAAELRLASLRKVLEARRKEIELQQARRDQKQTDERAAIKYHSNANGPSGQEG